MNFQSFNDLCTDRLTLSLIRYKDVDIIYDLRSNHEVQKYIQRDPFTNVDQAQVHIKKVIGLQNNREAVTWIIKLKSDSKKVGSICFWNFSSDRKTAEIGYDLLPTHYNKGIMNEAMKAILDFGFETLQLKMVEAFTSKYNKGSIALLEKNNFEYQKDRFDEGFPDNVIYSLLR